MAALKLVFGPIATNKNKTEQKVNQDKTGHFQIFVSSSR